MSHKFSTALRNILLRLKATAGHAGADADFVGFGRTGPASPANLHQLGIDHTQLTYKFQGRHYRLTDVHGDVIHETLA
ncbi:MAG: DUF1501 domain-containing protein [Opitutae bacterium]|nr:DUF1501 domain-containing protein [Opitutae bacterium]